MFELIYCMRSLVESAIRRFADELSCEAVVGESVLIEDPYWVETRLYGGAVLQSRDGVVTEISPVAALVDIDMVVDGDGSFNFTIPDPGVDVGDRLIVRFIQDFGDLEGALANSLLTGIAEVWKWRDQPGSR